MDATTFRNDFPEFDDAVVYTDASIEFYLALGAKLLNQDRWSDMLDYGLGLFAAHHLVVAYRDQQSAAAGGSPGEVKGPTSSKSVDKVSVSYDTAATTFADAGFWNSTMYGIRLYQMIRLVGAGGVQL